MQDSPKRFDVVAVGNAIVDVLCQCNDDFITQENLVKGAMRLIDETEADRLYNAMPQTRREVSGGSAANTIAGLATLGAKVGFIGKVATDNLGTLFTEDMQSLGVEFSGTPFDGGIGSGRSMIFVTPDAQRTMNTFLGASVEFTDDDIDVELLQQAKVIYLEGYLYDRPKAKKAYEIASKIAHENGAEVALSLSDLFCVDRHRAEFKKLIANHVDILFANHEELMSLYETDDLDFAIEQIRKDCKFAAITFSSKGSLIVHGGEKHMIDIYPVDVVDSTGAGDLYAAGFLYGHTRGLDPVVCGRIGTLCASEIVSHLGARCGKDLLDFVLHGLHSYGLDQQILVKQA